MFGECHAHIIMDGKNYREAVNVHKNQVMDDPIRQRFREYQRRGISFVRDGGDALFVSKRAKELAPEFGIDYRTPVYAIHKKGHYGAIVGAAFEDFAEYEELVRKARALGADFIKIMTTGILDFQNQGDITGEPLKKEEVKEMIHIAHEEGMSVMVHANGSYGVQAALLAGADSIEHGNGMDDETIRMLSESTCVWVPTLVTIRNLENDSRFSKEVIKRLKKYAEESLHKAYKQGAFLAVGSDAGAYMVPHGEGTEQEAAAVYSILGDTKEVRERLQEGETLIRKRFQRI